MNLTNNLYFISGLTVGFLLGKWSDNWFKKEKVAVWTMDESYKKHPYHL